MKRDSEHLTNLHEDMGLRVLRVVPRRRLGVAALGAVVAALALFTPRFVPAVEAQTLANNAATFVVSATPSAISEGEVATVTVATSNGVTFEADQTITLALSGTASSDDYEVKPKSLRLTLPAGEFSATVSMEGLKDDEEEEAETVTISASHGGVLIGSATVTITSISHDATLSALSLSGIDIGTFSGAETSYSVFVEEAVETATVTATASHPEAAVSIKPGAEVSLAEGDNEIAVTVTAADGFTTETYTVTVSRHVRPLTASFMYPPVSHVGSGTFSLKVIFSEPVSTISTSFQTLKEQYFQVMNGELRNFRSNFRRVSGNYLWDIEVAPSSTADVAVMLPPTTDCAAAGAVCTASGKPLSNRLTVLIPGPANTSATGLPSISGTARVGQTLTADTSDITDPDGLPNSFTYHWQRFAANGTTFEANIGTDANTYTLTSAEVGKRIKVRVTFTDGGGTEETLLSGATVMVAESLTASFSNMPESHDATAFTFELGLSEDLEGLSYWTLRDSTFTVTEGNVTRARRLVQGSNQRWELTVAPGSLEAVTIALSAGAVCDGSGTHCTSNTLTARVLAPPVALSVADAEVREGPDATLDFTVNLSRTTNKQITVYYRTYDGTARAGVDYEAAYGTVVFAPGETEKTVSVAVLDDAHDEGTETMDMWLLAVGGLSSVKQVTDRHATGTIVNSDPLQRAWLARFGRTVGTHVTDAVGERLRVSPGQGSHLTVGGHRLPLGKQQAGQSRSPGGSELARKPFSPGGRGEGEGGESVSALLQGFAGVLGLGLGGGEATPDSPWLNGPGSDPRLGESRTLAVDLRQVLQGSSFRLSLNAADAGAAAPRLTAWGRFAGTTFTGQDSDLALDGDVFTGTVGVDGEWDRLLIGVAVAHSRGEGSFTMPGTADRGQGDLEQTMTTIHPYLRYAVTDRLDVWGLVGYGWGELDLETDQGMTLETDTNLVMGAFGGRGILLAAEDSGGFQLATRTDAMLTRTSSDAVTGLAETEADAHRVRVVLEGSRGVTWADGRSLTPTVELGLRHDAGDAETGFGLEVGGRVQYADPTLGLTIEGTVRGLLAHEDEDYQEWGASGHVRLVPGPDGRGLALALAPTWGAAQSGIAGLWSRQTTAGLAPQGTQGAQTGRLAVDVGYGLPAPFGRGLLTPYVGTVLTEGAARTYRVGTRVQVDTRWATGLTLNLEGQRQEPAGPQPVNQGLRLHAAWTF